MKTLYFDCSSGISGDMTLGALLDLGIDKEKFVGEMSKINVDGYDIVFGRAVKNGIGANKVDVVINVEGFDEEGQPLEHDHEHHHHHHGEGECDDPECACHHHHHHADEVFTSWGAETPKQFTQADIDRILTALDSGEYGAILRAKGIVPAADGQWLHFDYVPQEHEVRYGAADYTGRLCVIGSQLKEDGLKTLFGL